MIDYLDHPLATYHQTAYHYKQPHFQVQKIPPHSSHRRSLPLLMYQCTRCLDLKLKDGSLFRLPLNTPRVGAALVCTMHN